MRTISFPKMFTSYGTLIFDNPESIKSSLRLLLLSDKGSLFGDPYYGSNLKKLIYDQNNQILRDIVIDDIYTTILTFMPQLILERKNINITSSLAKINISIKATNLLDYTTDTYVISLTGSEE